MYLVIYPLEFPVKVKNNSVDAHFRKTHYKNEREIVVS